MIALAFYPLRQTVFLRVYHHKENSMDLQSAQSSFAFSLVRSITGNGYIPSVSSQSAGTPWQLFPYGEKSSDNYRAVKQV